MHALKNFNARNKIDWQDFRFVAPDKNGTPPALKVRQSSSVG
jgi:hypothetical protein